MEFLMNFVLKLKQKLINREKLILKLITAFVLILMISISIEIYGFGHGFSFGNVEAVGKDDIEVKNFVRDGQDSFISEKEDASLDINTNGKYIQNLELTFAKVPNYGITLKYIDPKTNQEIVLEKTGLQKSMQKNELSFLKFLVFKIDNNPQKITILTNNVGTSISDIKIDNAYHFNFSRFIFIFLTGLLIYYFILLRREIGQKPEYIFFTVALVSGMLLAATEPRTFVSWDEAIHYKRADDLSFNKVINNNLNNIYSNTNSIPASFSMKEQEAIDQYFDNLQQKAKKHKSKAFSIFNFSPVEFYNQIAYLPSAFAFMLGRIMHLPNHMIFIFGRWINILVYSTVVFFAIRKLKSGKMLMSVIALFPTSIFLASNYGYDYWVTAFSLLGLAYLFGEIAQPKKKINSRDIKIMLGLFIVGLGPKAIYFPIMFLLFLLKRNKFESQKEYKKFIYMASFAIFLVVASFLVPFVVVGPGSGDHRGGEEVNAAKQVQFILSEPVAYSKILASFMLDYINPKNAGGFMTFFAYLGGIKGFIVVMSTLVVAAIFDKNKYDKETSDWKVKLLMLGIFLATVALICSALYISFTALMSPTIAGVQPRYLIPLIFPFLFVFGCSSIKNPINKNFYSAVIFAVMTFVLLQGIWTLLIISTY